MVALGVTSRDLVDTLHRRAIACAVELGCVVETAGRVHIRLGSQDPVADAALTGRDFASGIGLAVDARQMPCLPGQSSS